MKKFFSPSLVTYLNVIYMPCQVMLIYKTISQKKTNSMILQLAIYSVSCFIITTIKSKIILMYT